MKTIATFLILFFSTAAIFAQPKLSSFPSAKATVFLDFDGQTVTASPWNGGQPLYCAPSGLTDAQITEIFQRVSEDFRPFNINITTDSTVFFAAPLYQRIRMIVTPTSSWYQGVGGVAFTGSFTWGDGTPGFIFPDRLAWSPKIIAECCSHETGHTLGLSHQAKFDSSCNLITVYNQGDGTGQTSWAPVMGNSYYRNFTGWNNGPTPSGCSADQDNLSIITGVNGFTYRTDDHSNVPGDAATLLPVQNDNTFSGDGIISTNTDQDVFKFVLNAQSELKLNVTPFSVGLNNEGADLDVKVVLMNSNFEIVNVYDPLDKMDVSVDSVFNPGTYYIQVSGSGNQFATNYGSLGSYHVAGTLATLSTLAIQQLDLKGSEKDGIHNLTWNLVCDEAVLSEEVQVSYDGISFSKLASVNSAARSFEYRPMNQQDAYYRVHATTISGVTRYSNIVMIRYSGLHNSVVLQSNLVRDRVIISSQEPLKYILIDVNGKILQKGNLQQGQNVINISNSPNGIYFIQMAGETQKLTQRIVKL